jgi:hypothetical protein
LILGQLTDFISGDTLDDTLDERHRQKIGRFLVERKRYLKQDITPNHELAFQVEGKCARIAVTYLVRLGMQIAMIIQYGPGSLVTRHRPAIALSRLVADYQVPVVVVTNGEQADILNGVTGEVETQGLDGILDRDQLLERIEGYAWPEIDAERAVMEARILMAFEVDDRCPCDDSVCTLNGG